jgi:single-strand DNA-binding protein
MSVNKFILIGRVGQDPDTRYLPDGTAVTQLSIATSNKWKDKSGQQKEKTEWHRVKFFGKQAEIINEHVKKGSQMYIEGRMEYGEYEKDGHKVYTSEVRGQVFQFIGGKDQSQSAPSGQQSDYAKSAGSQPEDFSDDIPF